MLWNTALQPTLLPPSERETSMHSSISLQQYFKKENIIIMYGGIGGENRVL